MTPGLLVDARQVVWHAFRGADEFSCLTGSCATGTATATSDIDIVVVLRDRLPVDEAVTCRETFTREYVRLHRRHGRRPDLRYPGEVLYRSDLVAALGGRCRSTDGATTWCDESEPYRYWVSMIATGISLTHPEAFDRAADDCAETITAVAGGHDGTGPILEELKIDRVTLAACPRLARCRHAPPAPGSRTSEGAGVASSSPVLEAFWPRWRTTADLAHRNLPGADRATMGSHRSGDPSGTRI